MVVRELLKRPVRSARRAAAQTALEEARSRSMYLRTYAANGRAPIIDASAAVHPTAVLIGEVRIGPECWIGPNATLRADQGPIVIGARTSIQDNCVLHTGPGGSLSIGEEGQIGHGAMLHGCTIGRNVLIGMGAILLNGVKVGSGSIVAAGSLLLERTEIPPESLAVGSPGKVRRPLTEIDKATIDAYAQRYIEYKNIYRREVTGAAAT